MINTAPKFKKVVLILKDKHSIDEDIVSTVKIEHDDCAMIITGDYVIITEDHGGDKIDSPSSVKGKIYELKEIDSYQLYHI